MHPISRRQALKSAGAGFGLVALAEMLGNESKAADRPLAPKAPHFKPRAKRIIFVFLQGAVSQHDTFEYKPQLQKNDGKPGPGGGTLTASKFAFKQYGQTGSWFSELLPSIGYLPNLAAQAPASLQRRQLDLIQAMNRDLAASPAAPDAVDGVIESYELAFRMQGKIPELLDVSKEPQKVLDAYGVKAGPAGAFARQCLMARRLSEAGVRFVEICQPGWDHHNNLHKGLIDRCQSVDRPTAALLTDLEHRGLLDETLVLFGSEFGRLPTAQGQDGRDHNITGYTMFLTGAGVKKGFTYGATDEYGIKAIEGRMHTNDLHATLLALSWDSTTSG